MPVPLFYELVAEDLKLVEIFLSHTVADMTPLQPPLLHIMQSGGKRLRPILALLSGKLQYACANQDERPNHSQELCLAAAAIEALHTASLLHDDIIDQAQLRRGQVSVNKRWGDGVAMLAGDFFYATAVELLTRTHCMEAMPLFAEAAKNLCLGEANELLSRVSCDDSPERLYTRYFSVIDNKTAALFTAACEIGWTVAGGAAQPRSQLHRYGRCLGTVLQVVDDVLDFTGDEQKVGKKIGQDIQQGIVTLPLIYALQYSQDANGIKKSLACRDYAALVEMVRVTPAIERCCETAREKVAEAHRAIAAFPDNQCRRALEELADYLIKAMA